MSKRITVSVSERNAEFLREHPEISPSGMLQKALGDYRNLIGESKDKSNFFKEEVPA
jgi:hypothetical protein